MKRLDSPSTDDFIVEGVKWSPLKSHLRRIDLSVSQHGNGVGCQRIAQTADDAAAIFLFDRGYNDTRLRLHGLGKPIPSDLVSHADRCPNAEKNYSRNCK
jgi:hypothetical protein